MRYKQEAVTEFLTGEDEKPKKILERLKVIYGEDVSTIYYWARETQEIV